MKIACPSCEAKYSIGDEKVQNRLAKIRCRKCGADIVIDGRVEPPSITLAGAEAPPGAVATGAGPQPEFTVDFAENDQRTLSLSDIVAAYNSGQVTADTFVWSEGMTDWTPLGQVPAIVDALNAAASEPQNAAPAQARTASVRPQATATAATRATTKTGAGRDLFGRAASAGSEEDVATSQGGYDPQPVQTSTGARNESSVLFSLSALTASTKSKPSVPTASASVSSALDADSGLIDLKALASQASTTSPAASAASPLGAPLGAPIAAAPLGGAPPIGMAPLGGLGSPLGGAPFGGGSPFTAADLAMPPKKSKTGLFIGGGIALAGIIVALALALRPEPPPPPAPADPLPLPKPTHTAEPTPPPSSEAKPPPTGTAEETPAAKKAPTPKYGGKVGGGRKTTKEPGGGGGDSPPPPTPAKTSGGGGCAPGDLICEMKKAAGKK